MSLDTSAPFFVLINALNLSVGPEAGVSPSVELAKRMIFLSVSSSFFHPFEHFSSNSSSVDANLSLFLSSRDLARRLLPLAMVSDVVLDDGCGGRFC
jgi:hypothetical protein